MHVWLKRDGRGFQKRENGLGGVGVGGYNHTIEWRAREGSDREHDGHEEEKKSLETAWKGMG